MGANRSLEAALLMLLTGIRSVLGEGANDSLSLALGSLMDGEGASRGPSSLAKSRSSVDLSTLVIPSFCDSRHDA